MQIKVFSVPIVGGEAINEDLNKFLRGHKILQVEQQLVEPSGGAYWSFCVRYTDARPPDKVSKKKERKDYKEILSERDFIRFSRLRTIRLGIAKEDGVPAFAVFSDEELAGLAVLSNLTISSMQTVKGVGEKKVQKYGERFIKAVKNEKSE